MQTQGSLLRVGKAPVHGAVQSASRVGCESCGKLFTPKNPKTSVCLSCREAARDPRDVRIARLEREVRDLRHENAALKQNESYQAWCVMQYGGDILQAVLDADDDALCSAASWLDESLRIAHWNRRYLAGEVSV